MVLFYPSPAPGHPSGVSLKQMSGHLPGHLAYALANLWHLGAPDRDAVECLRDAASFLEAHARHLEAEGETIQRINDRCRALAVKALEHERRHPVCLLLAAMSGGWLYRDQCLALAKAIRPNDAAGVLPGDHDG